MSIPSSPAEKVNTAFPVLANNKNSNLKIHACDFSNKAVEVMRSHEQYDTKFIQADVWDVAGESLPPDVEEGSVDVVLMVFIFSALSPKQWSKAVRVLDHLNENAPRVTSKTDGGQIALRIALGYLDLRFADSNWRRGRPKLARWIKRFDERFPELLTVLPK